MTTPDRTEDLLHLMLERRAGAPPPGWLLPGVAEAVRQTGQARGGHAWSGALSTRRFGRLALVAAAALVLLALAAGVLVAAHLILPPPQPTLPAVVVLPSPSASQPLATPEPTQATNRPPPTATTAPLGLTPDTIAAVTKEGDGLRVRSKPSVGADSEKFTPLLKKGARMLVVDGPVAADGYEWYEVQADNDLFGWVASGKGNEDWIAPAEPECPDSLDESALWPVHPVDFLVCYGDTPVSIRGRWTGVDTPDTGPGYDCGLVYSDAPCSARPRWLSEPLLFETEGGVTQQFQVSAPPRVADRLGDEPGGPVMTLQLRMDAPEARDCRVVDDESGRDLISRDEAITQCRLRWVVRDFEWDPADLLPELDSMAWVLPARVPVHTSPAGPLAARGLTSGDEVLVAAGPVTIAGVNWYGVVPADPMDDPAGWVAMTGAAGEPTLDVLTLDCPRPRDWREVSEDLPLIRLACFGSTPFTADLTVDDQQAPRPEWGACDLYRTVVASPQPCMASPEWLATYSGVMATDARGRGMGVEVRFDPDVIARGSLPSAPQRMRVTGSFGHEAADECRVTNPDTGEQLLSDLEAVTYCRTQFVVTKLEPVR